MGSEIYMGQMSDESDGSGMCVVGTNGLTTAVVKGVCRRKMDVYF